MDWKELGAWGEIISFPADQWNALSEQVEKAYQENVLAPVLDQDEAEEEMEQEESAGMNMGM